MTGPNDYMEVSEICELFGVARNTVYRWRRLGRLKQVSKVGRKTYYRREDVYALIDPEAAEKDRADNA